MVEEGSNRKRDLAGFSRHEAVLRREREVGAVDCADAWTTAATKLAAVVAEPTYELWLEPIGYAGADRETLYLTAPKGIRIWVERRYSSLIREALAAAGETREVRFVGEAELCL